VCSLFLRAEADLRKALVLPSQIALTRSICEGESPLNSGPIGRQVFDLLVAS
jgi:hypothetical protein